MAEISNDNMFKKFVEKDPEAELAKVSSILKQAENKLKQFIDPADLKVEKARKAQFAKDEKFTVNVINDLEEIFDVDFKREDSSSKAGQRVVFTSKSSSSHEIICCQYGVLSAIDTYLYCKGTGVKESSDSNKKYISQQEWSQRLFNEMKAGYNFKV